MNQWISMALQFKHVFSLRKKNKQSVKRSSMTRSGKLMFTETKLRLYEAFILPYFHYCSMVWHFSS